MLSTLLEEWATQLTAAASLLAARPDAAAENAALVGLQRTLAHDLASPLTQEFARYVPPPRAAPAAQQQLIVEARRRVDADESLSAAEFIGALKVLAYLEALGLCSSGRRVSPTPELVA